MGQLEVCFSWLDFLCYCFNNCCRGIKNETRLKIFLHFDSYFVFYTIPPNPYFIVHFISFFSHNHQSSPSFILPGFSTPIIYLSLSSNRLLIISYVKLVFVSFFLYWVLICFCIKYFSFRNKNYEPKVVSEKGKRPNKEKKFNAEFFIIVTTFLSHSCQTCHLLFCFWFCPGDVAFIKNW